MTKAEQSSKLYWARRAAHRCVDCEAGIAEDDSAARCPECRERCKINSRRSRRKLPKKRLKERHEKQRARYWANPEPKRGAMRASRYERYEAGICKHCLNARLPEYATCEKHREICRLESYVKWLRKSGKPWEHVQAQLIEARKGAKIYPLPTRPAKVETPDLPLRDEDGHGQWRLKLLRALRFFDWTDTQDLFNAMGVAQDSESAERNAVQVALGRLVRLGLVERRAALTQKKLLGVVGSDYRITDAGRAEIGALRRAA